MLCLVKYMSAKHISVLHLNMKTVRGDRCIVNSYPQQLYFVTSLHPLGYHLATAVLRDVIKGTLCIMLTCSHHRAFVVCLELHHIVVLCPNCHV